MEKLRLYISMLICRHDFVNVLCFNDTYISFANLNATLFLPVFLVLSVQSFFQLHFENEIFLQGIAAAKKARDSIT